MKVFILLFLMISSSAYSACGLDIKKDRPEPYYNERNGELIYICENAIKIDRDDRFSDICVYKPQEAPIYIEEFIQFYTKSPAGYFSPTRFDYTYAEITHEITGDSIFIKSDDRDYMGVGTSVELSIIGDKGFYTIKNKDYLDSIVDILFERTTVKRWRFTCTKVKKKGTK